MIEPPHGILETPLGPVNFTMTEATHVFLHTESRNNEAITIRGIRYHVSYHCHLVDGQWTAKDFHDPYLSRKDCFNKEASQPARNTAREVLAKAWTDYLAEHPKLPGKAEMAKLRHEEERLESEVAECDL
jgi:hypothetical protein